MKRKYLILVTVSFFATTIFAQRNQIKAAESEFDNGNYQQAISILNGAEYLIFNAADAEKFDFFNLKGKVLTSLAGKDIEAGKNYALAIAAYQELIAAENESGKVKYSVQAAESIKRIKGDLLNSALIDAKANRFSESAGKMHNIYLADKKDTLQLYNAATYYMQAKEYTSALKLYEELKNLNFSGKSLNYLAVNKKTNEEELFTSASARDLSVKEGTHVKPRMEVVPSKKVEIYQKLAFIFNEKGERDKAEIYYNKILEMEPKNAEAYVDLAYIKLDGKKAIMDEMSNLGTSPKDMKTYDELKIKKEQLIKSAVFYLEKGNAAVPGNQEISKLLLNLYRSLDMTDQYNALKARS